MITRWVHYSMDWLWSFGLSNVIATSIQKVEAMRSQVSDIATKADLREYPAGIIEARDHIEALLSGYARYELNIRHKARAIQERGEAESARLLRIVLGSARI